MVLHKDYLCGCLVSIPHLCKSVGFLAAEKTSGVRGCKWRHYQFHRLSHGFCTAGDANCCTASMNAHSLPQGLPICVALSLTIIANRMAKLNVLVKYLASIETLGCITVLCSDKTGTLTLGKMARCFFTVIAAS